MQPLQNCIGPTIRIGQEILCLSYAGFFFGNLLLSGIRTPQEVEWSAICRNFVKTYCPKKRKALYPHVRVIGLGWN